MVDVLIWLEGFMVDLNSIMGRRTSVSVGSGDNGPMTMKAAVFLSTFLALGQLDCKVDIPGTRQKKRSIFSHSTLTFGSDVA
jgi:hypothetical protein